MQLALVALAGAAGALTRHGLALAVGRRGFPWSTLGINVVGSFLLGLLLASATRRGWSTDVTVPIGAGFLGAFTTFSTFSHETASMVREGRSSAALAYVGLSVAIGVAAAATGHGIGSRIG